MASGLVKPVSFAGTVDTLTFNSDSLFTSYLTLDSAEPILRLTSLSDGSVHDGNYGTKAPLQYPIYLRLAGHITNSDPTTVATKVAAVKGYIGDYGTFTVEDSNNDQWTFNAYMGKWSAEADQPVDQQTFLSFTWAVVQIDAEEVVP